MQQPSGPGVHALSVQPALFGHEAPFHLGQLLSEALAAERAQLDLEVAPVAFQRLDVSSDRAFGALGALQFEGGCFRIGVSQGGRGGPLSSGGVGEAILRDVARLQNGRVAHLAAGGVKRLRESFSLARCAGIALRQGGDGAIGGISGAALDLDRVLGIPLRIGGRHLRAQRRFQRQRRPGAGAGAFAGSLQGRLL